MSEHQETDTSVTEKPSSPDSAGHHVRIREENIDSFMHQVSNAGLVTRPLPPDWKNVTSELRCHWIHLGGSWGKWGGCLYNITIFTTVNGAYCVWWRFGCCESERHYHALIWPFRARAWAASWTEHLSPPTFNTYRHLTPTESPGCPKKVQTHIVLSLHVVWLGKIQHLNPINVLQT